MKAYRLSRETRGQSSLEFLMTYGWAILVILVATIIAWQWGFFNLSGVIKPGYFGFWGVMPADFKMKNDGDFLISLENSIGANVTVTLMNVSMGANVKSPQYGLPAVLAPGKNNVITVSGLNTGNPGSRFEVFVIIEYIDSRTDDSYRSSGKIWGSYET